MSFSDLPRHHALLITSDNRSLYSQDLWKEVSALSPAHRYFNQTVLDIDTARSLISWAQAPYHEERIALVSFHTAGLPAQNAMLKMLEEPPAQTRFILVTTHKSNLIDTVLSRVRHIEMSGQSQVTSEEYANAEVFLKTASSMRMKLPFIVELLSRQDEEGRKDRERIKGFILSLVSSLQEKKVGLRYIPETLQIASYAGDSSSSGKALLEYLSLLLPVIK